MRVQFLPSGKSVEVEPGSPLVDAAAAAGITLNMVCGGEGTCGKCVVRLRESEAADSPSREVLACRQTVDRPLWVEIPSTSLLPTAIQTVVGADLARRTRPPSDVDGLRYGAAIDLGTTTLAAELIEFRTGGVKAVASMLNPQTEIGDDVISRIEYGSRSRVHLTKLQSTVLRGVEALIEDLVLKAEIKAQEIDEIVIAGNTTMQHAFCCLDLSGLAHLPFTPATVRSARLTARSVGIRVGEQAEIYLPPVIGGFVGGDTVAGIVCCNELTSFEKQVKSREPAMFIDIGTNGEIVLFVDGERWAAATAAGPAFEGARIGQGMRATPGAIERVAFDPLLQDFSIETIGGAPPVGVCGSGLIDAAAELLRAGLLSKSGQLATPETAPTSLPPALARRFSAEGGPGFILAEEGRSGRDGPVLLTQRDIRELQLASGAIQAGVLTLLRRAGLTPSDLRHIYIAGGFGQHIRRSNAQRIGLIPPEVPADRIRFLGNTSLAGARLMLLSRALRPMLESVARRTSHIDLSTDPDFQWTFAEAMLFPEA